MEQTESIQTTATDAVQCKYVSSERGYFDDPFVTYFIPSTTRKTLNRMPIINRGYYARSKGIDQLVAKFVSRSRHDKKHQVIILGAGFDTTCFRYLKSNATQDTASLSIYEVDFPNITQNKIQLIRKHAPLREALGYATKQAFSDRVHTNTNTQTGQYEMEVYDAHYNLIAADLREIEKVQAKLKEAGINYTLPTLVLSECVMIYMEPRYSSDLISWFGTAFEHIGFVVYEQILPFDAFGQKMLQNIQARGCPLLSIEEYPTQKAQEQRFRDRGFSHVSCWDMNDIYYKFLEEADRLAKEKLEIFDELEEYHLLQQHYCLVVAASSSAMAKYYGLKLEEE